VDRERLDALLKGTKEVAGAAVEEAAKTTAVAAGFLSTVSEVLSKNWSLERV